MASTTEDLLIKIQADTGNASESIALLAKQLGKLENSLTSVADSSKATQKTVSGFGAAMVGVHAAIETARFGFEKMKVAMDATVGQFQKSQDGLIRLAGTLEKMGSKDVAGAVEGFKEFAEQLQKTTTIEDDQAIALLNIATAAGSTTEQAKLLVKTAGDLAATGRGDLQSAFNGLLKSLKGSTGALSIMVPELAGMTKESAKAGDAIKYVQATLGGLAEKELLTAAGRAIQLVNYLGDLGEEVGRLVSKMLGLKVASASFVDGVILAIGVVKDFTNAMPPIGQQVKDFADSLSKIDFKKLNDELMILISTLGKVALAFAALAIPAFIFIIGGLTQAVATLAGTAAFGALANALIATTAWISAATTASLAFAVAWAWVPLATAGVLTLVAGIEIVIRNFGTLQGRIDSLNAFFGTLALTAVNLVQTFLDLVSAIGSFTGAFDKSFNFFGKFDGLAQSTANSINRLNTGLTGAAIGQVNGLLDRLKGGAADAEKLGAAIQPGGGPAAGPKPVIQTEDEKKLMELRLKNYNELLTANKALDLENNKTQMSTISYLNKKNALEIASLRIKYKEGELGPMGTAELEKQIDLMNQKNNLAVKKAPSEDFEAAAKPGVEMAKGISGAFEGGLSGVAGAASGMFTGVTAVMQAADQVVGALQYVVDFIPKILDAVANLFNSAADLPKNIKRAVAGLMDSFVKFTTDFIPGLFDMLPSILLNIIDTLFTRLPKAMADLFKDLPTLFMNLVDQLPDIAQRFIQSLIEGMPQMATSMIKGLIANLPKMTVAMIKMFAMIIPSLAKGIFTGIKNALAGLFGGGGPKIELDTKALTDSMKKAARTLTGEASKLFKVTDLTPGDMQQKVKDQFEAVEEAGRKARNWLMEAWQYILDRFMAVINWLKEVWSNLINMLKSVWEGIINMFRAMWDAVKAIFAVIVAALQGIIEGFKKAFEAISKIGTDIWNGFKAGIDGAGDFFTSMGTKIWEGLWAGLQTLGDFLKNMFDKLNPANLFQKIFKVDMGGTSTVENALGIDVPFMKFAKGGNVPGTAQVPGDSAMNDRVLALLSPGEAVIPRSKMNNPFISQLVQSVLDGSISPPKFGFGEDFVESVSSTVSSIGGAVSGAGKDAYASGAEAARQAEEIARHAGGVASDEYKKAIEWLAQFDPTTLWGKVKDRVFKDMIMNMLGQNRFHEGGIIGGSGDVPILGQSGEFVMQRSAVQYIGANNLQAMNRGVSPANTVSNVYNIDIKVDAKTAPDEKFIRGTMLPILKEELRRASLDGQRVIFQSGVRA